MGAGETYLEAAIREVKEELNLEIEPKSLKLLRKFPPIGDEPVYIRAVYIYESDDAPRYNPEEFTEYYWLSPKELLGKLNKGEPAKRSLTETVVYLIEQSRK